jgi:heterodisulfide reductase subunit C
VTGEIRDALERILAAYEEIDQRLAKNGGLAAVLELYEQVRRELDRVSFQEIDRVTAEIKNVMEALLKISYELRQVHNLKLRMETRPPGSTE